MIKLSLETTSLLEKVKGQSIKLLVEKMSHGLGDRREEVVTTPFLENKSSTKNVDKGTGKLADTTLLEKKS